MQILYTTYIHYTGPTYCTQIHDKRLALADTKKFRWETSNKKVFFLTRQIISSSEKDSILARILDALVK